MNDSLRSAADLSNASVPAGRQLAPHDGPKPSQPPNIAEVQHKGAREGACETEIAVFVPCIRREPVERVAAPQVDSVGMNRRLPDHLDFFIEFEFRIRRYHRNVLGNSLGNDLPVKGIVMMDRHSEKLEAVIRSVGEHTDLEIRKANQDIFRTVSELAEFMLDGDLGKRDRAELKLDFPVAQQAHGLGGDPIRRTYRPDKSYRVEEKAHSEAPFNER